jgi:hypothetical protein
MNLRTHAKLDWLSRWLSRLVRVGVAVFLLLTALGPITFSRLAAAPSTDVTIMPRDRATGDPIDDFRYIINEDIAHDNASIVPPESYSPLVATGDNTNPTVTLPTGKYLVTVLAGHLPDPLGDGFTSPYKMWGQHFTIDGDSPIEMDVFVDMVPNPLPLATLRVRAFHDNQVVNGEEDLPVESGVEGFHVVIGDPVGEVTVDFFGNPICTEYDGVGGSTPLGDPVPMTGGFCTSTGADGIATIPNLPPGKYEVKVIPPDGEGWIQTTTIEGTHVIDAWIEEGATGFSTEAGFLTASVWFGFVRPCEFGDGGDDCTSATANDPVGNGNDNTITGHIRQLSLDTDAPGVGVLGRDVYKPYIALNDLSGNDEQVYTGRGDEFGNFEIHNVPPGLYQLVYWDYPLDYIIQFATVQVPAGDGQIIPMGDLGAPRWFGTISGYTYIDDGVAADGTLISGAAGNGRRDCYGGDPHDAATCERGFPGQDLDIRFKDGTIRYAAFTDNNGFYEFPEYFEWEHWLTWEVGFGRFAQGVTTAYETNEFGDPLGYPGTPLHSTEPGPAGLLAAQLTWAGTYQWIDTGKQPWGMSPWGVSPVGGTETNGAISGIVYYATTRNEFDPRLAAAEDYEPGIPGVTINLYEAALDGNGQPVVAGDGSLEKGDFLESVSTDSWKDNLPTDCDLPDFYNSGVVFDAECLELPRTWNQVKDGVFDGGYAFEGLAPGKYIVEVVPPAGYQVIKEEDQNTDEGDDYTQLVPPPPCAGSTHVVNDPRNPSHGQSRPLCDSRLVTVREGFNAGAEFFLMTDNAVPPPGMIRGLLVDDLLLQLNPDSPLYVEKRGIPFTPVGILDYAGNEITTVYSDADGYWEVLLPSTYTALCPIPSGICPSMYQVVGNYPGDPANPDPMWNPNYGPLRLIFEVWPAKTTYADVALVPTTGLIPNPTSGFLEPIRCDLPAVFPDLRAVSVPHGTPGPGSFFIYGTGFGPLPGAVTLDGTPIPTMSWSDTAIEVSMSMLSLVPAGPHQLLVTNSSGLPSITGLTFHRRGPGYNPTRVHVDGATGNDTTGDGSELAPYKTIEKALDVTPDGDLILVHPGTYYETLILDENVKLQGYGPGATVIDGRFFNFGGMTPQQFQAKIDSIAWDGPGSVSPGSHDVNQVPMGQVLTVLAENGEFGTAYPTQIDGFAIRGGSQVRGNVPVGATIAGGGIYAHAFARNMIISNNLIQTNSGLTGGGIILGQAYTANPDSGNAFDNQNDFVRIHHNRVLNNGGFRLAGGVALFNGAENYEIDHNDICGNYSAEYGGGISNFGMSSGHIHENAVRYNGAFDEGGGVMIAGEQALAPDAVSPGTGDVLIERNLIQANNTNDDGGGIRLLQSVDGAIQIINNMIVNNLATDSGGGISLDDALDVSIINNTIAKNISTATAEDADRSTCSPPLLGSCPHAAGISSEPHSAALRAAKSLPFDSFSDPVLRNNIIWENEAFYLDGTGLLPSAGFIDLEVVGTTVPKFMTPEYSILTAPYGSGAGNIVGDDPEFASEIDLDFLALPFAGDPAFVTVQITTTPADPQGDYHVAGTSPAVNAGTATLAPCNDFDDDGRPHAGGFDIGADEQPGTLPSPSCAPPGAVLGLYFSTNSNTPPPGVINGDDSDIYTWDGISFGRLVDATTVGVAGGADVDALVVVDSDTFYVSFKNDGLVLPGPLTVNDEDVARYDGGVWSLYFDGSDVGLGDNGGEDVDAFEILPDGSVIISTDGNPTIPALAGGITEADEDLLRCVGTFGPTTTCAWSVYFDGSDIGLNSSGAEDVDGVAVVGNDTGVDIYLSTNGSFATTGGFFGGGGDDVWVCHSATTGPVSACASYSTFYNGAGLASDDLDAFDLP